MPKVSIRGNQLTLPDDLREVLTSVGNDSLDAEDVIKEILLRRSPSAWRKADLANLREAQSGVGYNGPLPWPSAEEEEQWIADTLYAEKLRERAERNQK